MARPSSVCQSATPTRMSPCTDCLLQAILATGVDCVQKVPCWAWELDGKCTDGSRQKGWALQSSVLVVDKESGMRQLPFTCPCDR
jgi:hypothetical protein